MTTARPSKPKKAKGPRFRSQIDPQANYRCLCNRCHTEHNGRGCPACGCPEYRLERVP